MGIQSKGRGTAAVFGMLLLLAGVVGAIVLYVLSERRPGQAIDEFARAPVGCTTTLDFTETGTFYVYRETGGTVGTPDGGCVPVADPVVPFGFELTGDGAVIIPRRDDSIGYERDGRTGESVARFAIDDPGEYEIVVRGGDPQVVAAVGRDPDAGVDDLRRGAAAVAIAGIVLGALLLVLAGRRSKRAAIYPAPEGPGRGGPGTTAPPTWPPEPPRVSQVPLHPHQPPEPVGPDAPAPQLERRTPVTPTPWAPPSAGDAVTDAPPPPDPATGGPPPLPPLRPTLPDEPRRDE